MSRAHQLCASSSAASCRHAPNRKSGFFEGGSPSPSLRDTDALARTRRMSRHSSTATRPQLPRRPAQWTHPLIRRDIVDAWFSAEPPMLAPPDTRRTHARERGELELSLQPMVQRPSLRFAFLFPDEIGAHRDFIFGCFRTSVRHWRQPFHTLCLRNRTAERHRRF